MSFLEPVRLWLLVGLIGLLVGYVVVQWRRRAYAVRFTNVDLLASVAPRRPGWRRHVPAVVYLLALGALIVGFARPTRDERVPQERATIIMAIDTSLSMQATDVAPDRLQAAQAAADTFLDEVPPRINVGLVTFNGNAALRVPPTTDRDAVRSVIADLELGERTAIGEAIFTGLDAIDDVPTDDEGTPAPARIVLMSDGTTTEGRSNESAADAAAESGVPVWTIAFGTDFGTIRVPEEPVPIPVPVDRPALQAIAETTDGQFYAAATQAQLTDVYENIGSSVGFTTEPREISTWFIGGALLLLLVGGGLSLAWFSRLP